MTPQEIRAHREALGMTQGKLASLVGVDARTWRRWEAAVGGAGARAMPVPVWRLLRLLPRPGVRAWLEEMGEG